VAVHAAIEVAVGKILEVMRGVEAESAGNFHVRYRMPTILCDCSDRRQRGGDRQ
jgi:hypothetical protein